MSFQPRGLLRTPSREELWAETSCVALDLRESKTSEFWEDVLHDVFIKHDHGYYVNAQRPLELGSTKYCDFIVSVKDGNLKKTRLVIVKEKGLKAYQSKSQIEALEMRLKEYCEDALQDTSIFDRPFVFGLAVTGTHGRMFCVRPGEGLEPVLSKFAAGAGPDGNGYRDAAEDVWIEAFTLVKRIPPSDTLANPL